MTQNGWIKLYRSLTENWLWQEDRVFSKAEAWIDLLLMVNHADEKVMMNGQLITVRMGNKVTSIKSLSDHWKWSRDKVANFLKLLQAEQMITYKPTSKNTLISISKWAFYQSTDVKTDIKTTSDRQQVDITPTSDQHQTDTNKNVKNVENVKNVKKKTYGDLFDALWSLYPVKRGKDKVTDAQKSKLYAIGCDELKRAIERYCQEQANTDLKYWKNGSTFFNSGYVDYLDANYEPMQKATTKEQSNPFLRVLEQMGVKEIDEAGGCADHGGAEGGISELL